MTNIPCETKQKGSAHVKSIIAIMPGSTIFRRGGVDPFWGVLASNVGTFQ